MASCHRILAAALGLSAFGRAAPPAELVSALERLRDQKSYSWEVINADPGPVAQEFDTKLGRVTSVQQNTSPNLKGQIDRNGDVRLRREWADGLRLDTILTKEGASVTLTPEGWMTDREILTAQADERLRSQTPTPRFLWLRRADRPEFRRPDEELLPFLKVDGPYEAAGGSYVARLQSTPREDASDPASQVTVKMNVRNGAIRDYEVSVETTRRATRARVAIPVSEQRIVVITYVPVTRIDIPPEARAKLAAGARGSGVRPP
ncbi:MAG: hypothetical protein HZC55_16585 [Verrucomicrobia bacterium]|nr:hypothetical protein [Verrucomicrobiota bacterium]